MFELGRKHFFLLICFYLWSKLNFLLLFLDPPTIENEIRETKFTRAENLLFCKVRFEII